jgi:hypothetical protein
VDVLVMRPAARDIALFRKTPRETATSQGRELHRGGFSPKTVELMSSVFGKIVSDPGGRRFSVDVGSFGWTGIMARTFGLIRKRRSSLS